MSQRENYERLLARLRRLEQYIRANANEDMLPVDDLIWFLDNDEPVQERRNTSTTTFRKV